MRLTRAAKLILRRFKSCRACRIFSRRCARIALSIFIFFPSPLQRLPLLCCETAGGFIDLSLSREEQNRHLADIDSPNNTGTISRRCSGKRIMTIGREPRHFVIIVMLYLSPFERLAHQGFVRGSRSDPRSLLSLRGA